MIASDLVPSMRRVLSLIDLTSLNSDDDAARVTRLAAQASTPAGQVAAVCVWPQFLETAKTALRGTRIPVAVVTNFPHGAADPERAAEETAAAVAQGADEIDVVFPYRALLDGDHQVGERLVRACREACGATAVLKVILETGQLADEALIAAASEISIDAGAHFLKTSTGKTAPGATAAAARVMIDAIGRARNRGRAVGFKASGGVRSLEQAMLYIELFERRLGRGAAVPTNFRIGASALAAELIARIEAL